MSSGHFPAPASDAEQHPFSLFVTLKFTSEEYKLTFLDDIAPLCAYIRDHEPETLSYEVLISDEDPLQVLMMERYRDQDNAFMKVHRSSSQFQEFRPKLKALIDGGHCEMNGESYVDSGLGFGDRAA